MGELTAMGMNHNQVRQTEYKDFKIQMFPSNDPDGGWNLKVWKPTGEVFLEDKKLYVNPETAFIIATKGIDNFTSRSPNVG